MNLIDISQPLTLTMPNRQENPVTEPVLPINNTDPDIEVYVRDEPGPGGAHHDYVVSVMGKPERKTDEQGVPYIRRVPTSHTEIRFQKGGKAEAGANGLTNEALLEIVRHRLACFQSGKFACKENASALLHTKAAIDWLQRRTAKRQRRGVEGKEIK